MPAKADVIIVLAGGIRVSGELPKSVLLRIQTAKKLFDQKRASKILMSGKWSLFLKQNPPLTEAEAMSRYAISLGIPKKALLLETHSNNTTSNAFYVWKFFLQPNHWRNIIVVTSDYHLPRTKCVFQALFGPKYQIDFVVAPAVGGVLIRLKRWVNERFQLYLTQHYLADVPIGGVSKLAQKYGSKADLTSHPMDFFLRRLSRNQAKVFLKLFQWL